MSNEDEKEEQEQDKNESLSRFQRWLLFGVDKASEAQESLKSFLSESKVSKDFLQSLGSQLDETKKGVLKVVGHEVRKFLQETDLQEEVKKLLTSVSFEIKTSVRFIPTESKETKPPESADVKCKLEEQEIDKDKE